MSTSVRRTNYISFVHMRPMRTFCTSATVRHKSQHSTWHSPAWRGIGAQRGGVKRQCGCSDSKTADSGRGKSCVHASTVEVFLCTRCNVDMSTSSIARSLDT